MSMPASCIPSALLVFAGHGLFGGVHALVPAADRSSDEGTTKRRSAIGERAKVAEHHVVDVLWGGPCGGILDGAVREHFVFYDSL